MIERFSDKEIRKFIDKTNFSAISIPMLVVTIFYGVLIYLGILGRMLEEKILIINPEFTKASPQAAFEWLSRTIEPLNQPMKMFSVMVFLLMIFFIVGLYQQYQIYQSEKILRKYHIEVIR